MNQIDSEQNQAIKSIIDNNLKNKSEVSNELDKQIDNENNLYNDSVKENEQGFEKQHFMRASTVKQKQNSDHKQFIKKIGLDTSLHLQDAKNTNVIFLKYKFVIQVLIIIIFIQICLCILYNELFFRNKFNKYQNLILVFTSIMALLQIILTSIEYRFSFDLLNEYNAMAAFKNTQFYHQRGILAQFIFDLVTIVTHPNYLTKDEYWTEYNNNVQEKIYYYYNELFTIIQVMRLMKLVALCVRLSFYSRPSSERILRMYGADFSIGFTLKVFAYEKPIMTCIYYWGFSVVMFALSIRISECSFERFKYNDKFPKISANFNYASYINSFWLVLVTITTVGYGDVYARTLLGQILSSTLCIWGMFIVALTVYAFSITMTLQPSEYQAFILLKRLQQKQKMKQSSAQLLTTIVRNKKLLLSKDKSAQQKKKKKQVRDSIQDNLNEFAGFRKTYRQYGHCIDVSELVNQKFDRLKSEMIELKEELATVTQCLNTILQNQAKEAKRSHKELQNNKQIKFQVNDNQQEEELQKTMELEISQQ